MSTQINEENIKEYYRFLSHKEQSEIRVFSQYPKSIFVHSEREFVETCKKYNGKSNVYIGINERKISGTKVLDVKKLRVFAFDIDPVREKDTASTEKQKEKSEEITHKVVDYLKDEGYSHISIFDSGNGFHVYLKLNPIEITDKNRERIIESWKAFGDNIKKKFSNDKVHLDSVFDLSRIMKVPGTLSVKGKKENWRVSKIKYIDNVVNETLKEEILLSKPMEKKRVIVKRVNNIELNEVLLKDEKALFLYNGNTSGYTSRSEAELALACKLVWWELSESQIRDALGSSGIGKWNDKKTSQQYKDLTIKKAYNHVSETKSTRNIVTLSHINEKISKMKDEITKIATGDKSNLQKCGAISEELKEFFLNNYYINTIRESKTSDPEMWIYKDGIYIPCGDTYIRETIMQIMGHRFSNSYVNSALSKIRASTYICLDDFFKEADKYLLPVANGLLNVKTLEKEGFDPKKRFFSKINALYLPLAKCPKIKKFISEIVKEQDINLIQEMFGFCLVRGYSFKKAYMLLGRTDAGKSKLLQLLHDFLGYKNCSSVALSTLIEEGFLLWKLHGKLANISGDNSNKSINNGTLFKKLVGDDPITADRKFKEAIEFFNYAKILNATNTLPKTFGLDDAFFNRWNVIKFPNRFIENNEYIKLTKEELSKGDIFKANKNILDELTTEEELSGLLNWAIEGLHRLLEKGEFSYNKTAKEVKIFWLRESNSFEAFFMDCLEETKSYSEWLEKEQLRNAYKNYCKKHDLKIESDKVIKHCIEREHGAYEKQLHYRDDDDVLQRPKAWVGVSFSETGEKYNAL